MDRKKPMVQVITATEAKNRFGEIIKRAYLGEEHLIVERGGIPVVAIVPIADYERLIIPEEMSDELAKTVTVGRKQEVARRHLIEFLDRLHGRIPAVPDQDIEEAIQAVRAGE